jgi:hypothetical protein
VADKTVVCAHKETQHVFACRSRRAMLWGAALYGNGGFPLKIIDSARLMAG